MEQTEHFFVLNPAYSTSLCNEQRKFQHSTKEEMSAAAAMSHFIMHSATVPVDIGPKDRRCWKIHDPSEVLKQCVCCGRGDFGSWRRTHRFVKLANYPPPVFPCPQPLLQWAWFACLTFGPFNPIYLALAFHCLE